MCVCVRARACACVRVNACVRARTCVRARVRVCVCAWVECVSVCLYVNGGLREYQVYDEYIDALKIKKAAYVVDDSTEL